VNLLTSSVYGRGIKKSTKSRKILSLSKCHLIRNWETRNGNFLSVILPLKVAGTGQGLSGVGKAFEHDNKFLAFIK
jgi:hypothetical protein